MINRPNSRLSRVIEWKLITRANLWRFEQIKFLISLRTKTKVWPRYTLYLNSMEQSFVESTSLFM